MDPGHPIIYYELSTIHSRSKKEKKGSKNSSPGTKNKPEFQIGRDLIEEEASEENRVKAEIYIYYFKAMGIGLALLGVLFYALFQTFTVGANLWLSIWSEDEEAATNIPKRNLYLGVYGALGLLQVHMYYGVHTPS